MKGADCVFCEVGMSRYMQFRLMRGLEDRAMCQAVSRRTLAAGPLDRSLADPYRLCDGQNDAGTVAGSVIAVKVRTACVPL